MERDRHSTCSLAESSAAWGLLMSDALQPSDGLALGAAGLSSKNLLRARAGSITNGPQAPNSVASKISESFGDTCRRTPKLRDRTRSTTCNSGHPEKQQTFDGEVFAAPVRCRKVV